MKSLMQKLFFAAIVMVAITGIVMGRPTPLAKAAFNGVMNYQGKLTNSSYVAVADGTYNMRFKLYDALTDGSLLWTETRTGGNKVQVTNGLFSVMLGEVDTLSGFDFNQTLFLSVEIGGTGTPGWDGEMTPRKKLGAVPVAFLASNLKGEGVIDITNTSVPQASLGYDTNNKLTIGVSNAGVTTLTAISSGTPAFNLTGGNVGIGTATTSAKLHVTATTEQFRTSYDPTNYTSFTTDSNGDLTIAPSGGDFAVTGNGAVSGNVDVAGTLTSGTGNAFQVSSGGAVTAVGVNAGAGLIQGSLGLTVTGATVNLNASSNFAVNIGTGTTNAAVTIGGNSNTVEINSSNWDVSTTGAISGLTGITMTSGDFLQSGAGTFGTGTGAVSLNGDVTIAAGKNLTLTAGVGTITQNFQPLGTTATANGLTVTPLFTLDATDQTLSGVYINPNTNSNNDTGDILYGVNIDTITASSAAETAIRIGTGWDTVMSVGGDPAIKADTTLESWMLGGATGNPGAGAANVGVGFSALNSCTTGCNNNLAFGSYALWQNTAGNSNAAFGSSALIVNALGVGNTGIGREALQGNKDGSANVAIGYNALRHFNYDAVSDLETFNVGIGAYVGVNSNTAGDGLTSGVQNTLIGARAGRNMQGSDLNVMIGYNTGRSIVAGDKNTIIGSQIDVGSDLSNTIILGDGDGNIRAQYTNSSSSWSLTGDINLGGGSGSTGCTVTDSTGVFSCTADIAVADGGTGASTSQAAINNLSQLTTNGDLLYHNGTNSTRLARGSNGECLTSTAATIQWGSCGSGGGYATIQDEAGALTQRAIVNFTGAGVACVDNAGSSRTDCTIAGGGSTTWDTIGDAAGNGAVAMGTTVQTLDWGATTTTDNLTVTSSATGLTSGSAFKVTSATTGAVTNGIVQLQASGNYSGVGGLLNVAANSTTAGVVAKFSGTGLTTGTGINVVGGTSMTTGSVLNINSTAYQHFAAETGNLVNLQFSDESGNTSGTSITNGLNISATLDTSGAGLKQVNALNIDAPTISACDSGACTVKGLNVIGGTGSVANVTSYGAYIDAGTGSGTEYAAAFMNGNVGIGTDTPASMLQIGSAINRGDLQVYGDVSTLGAINLTAIAGIKDVFVYDTTADSDGGRWIDWATTEQLSWYTETKDATGSLCNISSNDRCGASSFPRKATLVVTASALYIFDTSNNTLWMKFSQNASGYALGVDSSNDPSSVTALNGVIYVGTTDGAGGAGDGLYAFDFINDRMWNYDATDRSAADVGIGSRNGAVTYNTNNDTTLDIATVGTLAGWETINDVFAVTPNHTLTTSTISGATNATPGYGNTYVGLATNSGITIINITHGKLVQYSDATDNDYTAVHLTKTGRMYALNTTLDQLERWDNYDSDGPRASRVNGAYSAVWDQSTTPPLSKTTPNMIEGAPDAIDVIERASSALETEDLIYVGHSLGMTEIHGHTTTAAGWVKWYSTTRQTMLQPHYNDVALPLDETSGTVADSATIVDNDMTYKGTFTLGASGVRGKGVNLGGAGYLCSDTTSDGTCDVDTAFNMSTVGWTITMWFNHTTATPGAPEVLFDKCYTAGPIQATGCVQAYMTTGGLIGVGIDDDATWTLGSSYDITATSVNRYNDGQWHMLTMSRTNANDLDVYIDGNALNLSNATGLTTTVDGSQIVALGAACNATANCATAGNFWNGSIDDFTFAVQTTTLATVTNAQQRRLYNDARPLVNKRVITVDNATTATSTTIGDSGESWQPNEFAGLIVTLTGNTGAGQTRRVVSNTATVLTVSPPFDTTPDTSTDFEVDPEALYGSSDSVTAIGITNKALLGEARLLCAGTDSTTGTGGVTCYNHQAGPNVIADIFHGDGKKTDDHGIEWTDSDTDSDDIRAIDLSKRGVVIATDEHIWSQAENVQLGQGLDYLINQLYTLRNELVLDGVTAAGSTGIEIGFTGGADLAEYYNSTDALRAGDVVAIDPNGDGDDVIRYTGDSSQQVLGVVASKPAIILGERLADGYPIALTGRIPVNFSNENGEVKPGDYIAPSSIEGHAMRATGAGVVLGKALAASNTEANSEVCNSTEEPEVVEPEETPEEEPETTDPENPEDSLEEPPVFDTEMCGKVMMFVELGSFPGLSVEQLMEEMELTLTDETLNELPDEDALLAEDEDGDSDDTKQDKILAFLKQMKTQKEETGVSSQILTDRLSATFEVISPSLVAEGLQVTTIGTDDRSIKVLGDLEFIGRPYLNSDSGGFAKITAGARYVDIEFEKEYVEQPTVNVTITIDEDERIANENDAQVVEAINVLQDAQTEQLFGDNIQFLVTRKSVKGFRIIINQPASQDITFSWLALAVKQPRLTVSEPADSTDPVEEDISSDEGLDQPPVEEDSSDSSSETGTEDSEEVVESPSDEVEQIENELPEDEPLPPSDEETPGLE